MVAPPTVLFLALDTYSRVGGLQRFNRRVVTALAELADAAGSRPPRVHIMRDRPHDLPPDLAASVTAFGPSRLGFVVRSLAAARRVDVLLLGHIALLPVGWLAKRLRPGLRLVLFAHGVEVWGDAAYRRVRRHEAAMLRSVDTVAAVSRYTAARMASAFRVPPARFAILANAVDGPLRNPPRNTQPVVLGVTRLAAHDRSKNVDRLIHAFAPLATAVPDARLEIVGDGVLRPELEALAARLGLASHVAFHGAIGDAALEDCYRRARVFALPSSKEGFGIVYLEAWRHGLPVICGSEGAPREIVSHGENGFVVDPSDTAALSGALCQLLMDPTLAAEMGRRGADKVRSRFLHAHFRETLAGIVRGSA